jgi:hypothetical protein
MTSRWVREVRIGYHGPALDAATGAACQLACRVRRAVNDRSDLVEGHGEHVV